MPVTSASSVIRTLHEVFIHQGGAVTVTLKASCEGMADSFSSYEISQAEAIPLWFSMPDDPTKNRWEDLCGLLYKVLIDRGDIVGVQS